MHPGMSYAARLATHSTVSASLAKHSDEGLNALVARANPLGSGIGGRSALLDVDGTRVFVKRVPLTAAETLPEHVRSTANLFGLPTFFQYGIGQHGIGGPGFGAWRELAVHLMTTDWVLEDQFQGFPLMYHWRVLPDPPGDAQALPDELADVDRAVAYWGGGPEVRRRIEALQQASASLALFLEYVPYNLHQWLGEQIKAGEEAANRACTWVDEALHTGTSFMNSRELLYFDAHFENILTDGRHLYFTDYGLALSSRFDLSPEYTRFFERHRTYDRCYTITYLVKWLVTAFCGYGRDDRDARDALVRACARGARPTALLTALPDAAAEIVTRHAPIATVIMDFLRELEQGSRRTPYPLENIRRTSLQHDLPSPTGAQTIFEAERMPPAVGLEDLGHG
jgi:hypothetical protein